MSLTLYTSRSSTPTVFTSTQTTQHYVCLALTPPRISHSSGVATYVVHTGKRDTDIDQLHLEKQFVVKIGTTAEQNSLLLNEASIYTGALEGFKHAPEFFGVFSGYVGGEKALCEMLEFCGGGCVMDQDELNRQTILAICSLHTGRGILHGRLSAEHPQHIIPVGRTVKIVDYTRAIAHRCPNAAPLTWTNAPTSLDQCAELNFVEANFGDAVTGPPERPLGTVRGGGEGPRPSLAVLARRGVFAAL